VIPGFQATFNGESMMKLHNLAVQQVRPAILTFQNLGDGRIVLSRRRYLLSRRTPHLLYTFFTNAPNGFCASQHRFGDALHEFHKDMRWYSSWYCRE